MKKTFLLLIAVCFCFSSAYASEEFQSRKVRVENCDSIYYYQNENLTNSFENNKPQYATIYSVGFDTVKLVFEDGTVGFINKTTFNYLIKDGKYIREEAALLEKLKKEEEKEKAAEEEAFLADLKQDGIYKGR